MRDNIQMGSFWTPSYWSNATIELFGSVEGCINNMIEKLFNRGNNKTLQQHLQFVAHFDSNGLIPLAGNIYFHVGLIYSSDA